MYYSNGGRFVIREIIFLNNNFPWFKRNNQLYLQLPVDARMRVGRGRKLEGHLCDTGSWRCHNPRDQNPVLVFATRNPPDGDVALTRDPPWPPVTSLRRRGRASPSSSRWTGRWSTRFGWARRWRPTPCWRGRASGSPSSPPPASDTSCTSAIRAGRTSLTWSVLAAEFIDCNAVF